MTESDRQAAIKKNRSTSPPNQCQTQSCCLRSSNSSSDKGAAVRGWQSSDTDIFASSRILGPRNPAPLLKGHHDQRQGRRTENHHLFTRRTLADFSAQLSTDFSAAFRRSRVLRLLSQSTGQEARTREPRQSVGCPLQRCPEKTAGKRHCGCFEVSPSE